MSVHEITGTQFEAEVLTAEGPVLVDFWAPWCGPCRMLGPVLDELAGELKGQLKVVKVNVDDNPELAGVFGIRSIPTMLLFKDGKLKDQKTGVLSKDLISSWALAS